MVAAPESPEPSAAPHAAAALPPAGPAELERALAELSEGARALAAMPARELAALLRASVPCVLATAERLVEAAGAPRGVDPGSPEAAEAWIEGPRALALAARLHADALDDVARRGRPRPARGAIGELANGRAVVRLGPPPGAGAALHARLRAEVHLPNDVRARDVPSRQAARWRGEVEPVVALVLDAGATPLRALSDVLHLVAVRRQAVLLRPAPHAAALGPALALALAPLVGRGLVRTANADDAAAVELAHHPLVGAVHLHGSRAAHDVLVWGAPGPERAAHVAAGTPALAKPMTSLLGNASPVLVMPYLYAADELAFQAESIASQLAWGGGLDPTSARVLVLPRGFAQRDALLDLVAAALAKRPPRRAPFAGLAEGYAAWLAARPDVRPIGDAAGGALPWAIARDLDPRAASEALFAADPPGPVLGEVSVGSDDPIEFLDAATRFCDERLSGTLCASLVAPPHHEEEPALEAALEAAIERLRYGCVAVAAWPGLAFAMGSPPWGAHASGTLAEPGSGLGFVQDACMLGGVEKVVLRAPLRARPAPAWLSSRPRRLELARRLTRLAGAPSVAGALGAVLLGMRG
jgi:hypothetical protein